MGLKKTQIIHLRENVLTFQQEREMERAAWGVEELIRTLRIFSEIV